MGHVARHNVRGKGHRILIAPRLRAPAPHESGNQARPRTEKHPSEPSPVDPNQPKPDTTPPKPTPAKKNPRNTRGTLRFSVPLLTLKRRPGEQTRDNLPRAAPLPSFRLGVARLTAPRDLVPGAAWICSLECFLGRAIDHIPLKEGGRAWPRFSSSS